MNEKEQKERPAEAAAPGPARLYALLAGAFLAMLGVLGFFYDAHFGTGDGLSSDDLSGLLLINGWRNVIYLATGMLALAFAARSPRRTALGLGLFYLVFAIWGFDQTERDIGSLLNAIPLGDKDNGLHLALGIGGLLAALIDGPLPAMPERLKPRKPKNLKLKAPSLKKPKLSLNRPKRDPRDKPATGERGSRGRSPAGPRRGDAA